MTKLCLKDCTNNGLTFYKGCTYSVDFNTYDNQLYIYNVYGFTPIGKGVLDRNFL